MIEVSSTFFAGQVERTCTETKVPDCEALNFCDLKFDFIGFDREECTKS